MTKFGTYLLFINKDCKPAMEFYQSCLGGELSMTSVGESPMKDQFPPDQHDKIVHARLKSGAIDISASAWLRPAEPVQGNTVCLYISESTYEELKGYFDKLSEGASPEAFDPLTEQPFGTYGALTDKYGVRWMFQGDPK